MADDLKYMCEGLFPTGYYPEDYFPESSSDDLTAPYFSALTFNVRRALSLPNATICRACAETYSIRRSASLRFRI